MTFTEDKYRVVFEKGEDKVYAPINAADYHTSRYIELNNQMIYASSGTTKDVLAQTVDAILERVNSDKPIAATRSEIAILCNQIKYRMKFPVDELASLRMGCVMCFLPNEDPNTVIQHWLDKKMSLARKDHEWYAFFLGMGIAQQKQFEPYLDTSITEDYFSNRQQVIESLSPLRN